MIGCGVIPSEGGLSSLFFPSVNRQVDLRPDRGVKSDGAAQFTSANSESLQITHAAAPPGLKPGDIHFWFAGWVYLDSFPSGYPRVFSKSNGTTLDYDLNIINTSRRPQFQIINSSAGIKTITHTTVLSTGQWYFIICYHDATNDLIGLSLDGGAFQTLATGGGHNTYSHDIRLGSHTGGQYFDGRMDEWAFGSSNTASFNEIRDSLYNSGNAKTYEDLTASEKTDWGLVSYWKLNAKSGQRHDSHGTHHFTDNNTVTEGAGVVEGDAVGDNSVLSQVDDQSGNANHATQSTVGSKPTLQTAEQNGKPTMKFDGTDDFLTLPASAPPLSITWCAVVDCTGTPVGTIHGWTESSNIKYYRFYMASSNKPEIQMRDTSGNHKWWRADAGLSANYHVIVLTQSGVNAPVLYVDGATAAMSESASAGTVVRPTASLANSVGRDGAVNLGYFDDDIAEVGYYSDIKTLPEVTRITRILKNKYGI